MSDVGSIPTLGANLRPTKHLVRLASCLLAEMDSISMWVANMPL